LRRARRIALDAGMKYVYTGNLHNPEGDTTYCPGCGQSVIERDGYAILTYRLDESGHCRHCATPIAGRWSKFERPFGSRRIPVRIATA
jgi:pyruvate formate lyase activating enzyme